jgi:hypothetical protein
LFQWNTIAAGEGGGVVVLRDQVRALPRYKILDPKCPTLSIIVHLKRQGWRCVAGAVTHTTLAIGDYDGYEAVKKKFYFQALAALGATMPLTSAMPSRQPHAFLNCF